MKASALARQSTFNANQNVLLARADLWSNSFLLRSDGVAQNLMGARPTDRDRTIAGNISQDRVRKKQIPFLKDDLRQENLLPSSTIESRDRFDYLLTISSYVQAHDLLNPL